MKKKNLWVTLVTVLILLIPTYLAIYSYFSAKDEPIERATITAIQFCEPSGQTLYYEQSSQEGKELISLLLSVHENARSSASLPSELEKETPITVTYYGYETESVYQYYFSSTKPSNSYYVDKDGLVYRITAAHAILFLDSDYSFCLYPASQTPTFTVLKNQLSPSELDWSYSTYSGLEHKVTPTQADGDTKQLTCSYSAFSMNFDRTPEKALLKVTDSTGTLFYSGDYFTFLTDDYLYQHIKSDTTLHFALSASWSSTSVDQGSGTADYLFSVTILFDPTADFWLGESQIESGEFVVLSGNYIDDLEDIQITIEPSISYTPVFYRDGENIRALLPFPLSLGNEDREYTITVNYLGIVTELSLHVSTSSTAELHKRRYSYDVKVNTSVRTEENLLEFQNFLAQLPSQDEILFTGSFRFPTESIRAEFGDWIDNEGSDATTFLSGGMAFVCYPATAIYAVNSGKVVAITETTYGGTTVVVDHGLGLKSVYYCLAKVAVSTGDLVTSDTVIGYGSQKVGYTDGITAYIELWVGDQPVSYYPLLSDGRTGKIEWGEPS